MRDKDDYVKRKTGNQGWWDSPLASKIFAAALAILASYTGYEKVDEYRQANATKTDLTVKIESVAQDIALSQVEIQSMIDKSLKQRHEKDLQIFKQKEAWE